MTSKRHITLIAAAQAGDVEARNAVVEENLGLVGSVIVRKFMSQSWDECWQYGTFGLIGAVSQWHPTKGMDFAIYAWRAIYYKILERIIPAKQVQTVSLDAVYSESGEAWIENFANSEPSTEQTVIEDWETKHRTKVVRSVVKELPQRDKLIVVLRYGLAGDDPFTLGQISPQVGLTLAAVGYRLESIHAQLARNTAIRSLVDLSPADAPFMPGTKHCTGCERDLPLDDFPKRHANPKTIRQAQARRSKCHTCSKVAKADADKRQYLKRKANNQPVPQG